MRTKKIMKPSKQKQQVREVDAAPCGKAKVLEMLGGDYLNNGKRAITPQSEDDSVFLCDRTPRHGLSDGADKCNGGY